MAALSAVEVVVAAAAVAKLLVVAAAATEVEVDEGAFGTVAAVIGGSVGVDALPPTVHDSLLLQWSKSKLA